MKAEQMFKELGYKLLIKNASVIPRKSWNYSNGSITYFHYDFRQIIKFDLAFNKVRIIKYGCGDDTDREQSITITKHHAITQQMKELGWV